MAFCFASLTIDSSGETFIIKICFHLKLDLDEDLDDFCEVTYEEKTSERLRIFLELRSRSPVSYTHLTLPTKLEV